MRGSVFRGMSYVAVTKRIFGPQCT